MSTVALPAILLFDLADVAILAVIVTRERRLTPRRRGATQAFEPQPQEAMTFEVSVSE